MPPGRLSIRQGYDWGLRAVDLRSLTAGRRALTEEEHQALGQDDFHWLHYLEGYPS